MSKELEQRKNWLRKEVETLKPYIPGKPIEEIKRTYGLQDIIKLASNENPLGPSVLAQEAIVKAARTVNLYGDPLATRLREALAAKLGVAAEETFVGNGGDEILRFLAMTLINTGDEAVMAAPSFPTYEIAVHHMGGIPVKVPLKDFKHDVDAMLAAVTLKTKMLFVCSPNNPTGNIMTKAELERLALKLPEQVLLVIDEAYFEYATLNPDYHNGVDLFKMRPNTLVLRTFSKVSGLAGIRVGYCITHMDLVREISKVKFVFNVSSVAEEAGLAALKDTRHIERTVQLNRQSLDEMMAYFNKQNWPYVHPDGNFVFVDTGMDSKWVFERLLEKGIAIRPGFIWNMNTWIRISSGTMEQTKIFLSELEIIRQSS